MSFLTVAALRRAGAGDDRAVTAPRGGARVVERSIRAYRRGWIILVSGLFEPVLYLFSIGVGVGTLVGDLELSGGEQISYRTFVAPALLVSSSMNGAVADTTFNFFVKFKYMHTYDAMLATPLRPGDVARGEATWAVVRGGIYALSFLTVMTVMGLVPSWWGLLCLPAALLVAFAFAGVGLAITTFMRSFVDFDYVFLAIIPMFLFSATFFPLDRYPDGVAPFVELSPLYQGVALSRAAILGDVHLGLAWHAVYLAVMGWIGIRVAARRLQKLLLP